MENTCKPECERYKNKERKCPNFILTSWTNNKGETKTVEDCAPIRNLILLTDLTTRVLCVEKAMEQVRNLKIEIGQNLTERINNVITKQCTELEPIRPV